MKKISRDEIEKIQDLFWQGYSVRDIAKIMGRSINTVLRYKPPSAQQQNQQILPQTTQMPRYRQEYKHDETPSANHSFSGTDLYLQSRSPYTSYDSSPPLPRRREELDLLTEIRDELKYQGQKNRVKEEQKEQEKLNVQTQSENAISHEPSQLNNRIPELTKREVESIINKQVSDSFRISVETLDQWREKFRIPFEIGIVTGDLETVRWQWGVQSLPWLILTDRQHVVRAEGFALAELDEKIAAMSPK